MNNTVECRLKAVIGLGNPGKGYVDTKHNAGFSVLDKLSEVLPRKPEFKSGFNGLFFESRMAGRNIIFLKPLTFMNLSGSSVLTLCRKEKLLPEELLIVYDDMDIPLGKIRIRTNGGSAGHNGVESIIRSIGSNKFSRLRIGIGRKNSAEMVDHVLSEFDSDEKEIFNNVVDLSVAAVKLSIHRGVQASMNEYNSQVVVKNTDN